MTEHSLLKIIQPEGVIIVPKYSDIEMFSRSIIADGLTKVQSIINNEDEPSEIRLKAVNTAVNIGKYITSRIDAETDGEDMLEEDEDYGIGANG